MRIYSYVPGGYTGDLVSVEVDIRRGIPSTDIVGLPDNAVREARDRVRVALRKTGLEYPQDRVLINLAPADVRKVGASFDLAIAIAVLEASGQLTPPGDDALPREVLVMGELQLDGTVRAVRGVLSAVAAAFDRGITHAVVPRENLEEARVLGRGRTRGVARLSEAVGAIVAPDAGSTDGIATGGGEAGPPADGLPAFEELQGQPRFKRVLEVAAAGRHNLIVVGPPGSGKTMGVRALPSILPDLDKEAALEVTRIYSRAGLLGSAGRIVRRPPFRAPHHTASLQGVVGGGRDLLPGEISLAHRGVLFLDEAAEFRKHVLQSLREPTEERRIFIARAGRTYWYPANYELAMAANPCPCGYFGHPSRLCSCSMAEITRYWKRLGGPLMDRIDLRVRVGPEVAPPEEPPVAPPDETSVGPSPTPETEARHRVRRAVERQLQRYATEPYCSNAEVPSSRIRGHLRLEPEQEELVLRAADRLSLSSRAVVSILRTALTIADLEGAAGPSRHHVLEAIQHRRMGEGGQWI